MEPVMRRAFAEMLFVPLFNAGMERGWPSAQAERLHYWHWPRAAPGQRRVGSSGHARRARAGPSPAGKPRRTPGALSGDLRLLSDSGAQHHSYLALKEEAAKCESTVCHELTHVLQARCSANLELCASDSLLSDAQRRARWQQRGGHVVGGARGLHQFVLSLTLVGAR